MFIATLPFTALPRDRRVLYSVFFQSLLELELRLGRCFFSGLEGQIPILTLSFMIVSVFSEVNWLSPILLSFLAPCLCTL